MRVGWIQVDRAATKKKTSDERLAEMRVLLEPDLFALMENVLVFKEVSEKSEVVQDPNPLVPLGVRWQRTWRRAGRLALLHQLRRCAHRPLAAAAVPRC